MPADTTVPVSDEVWSELMRRKKRGDTFDDVLRDLLGLDDDSTGGVDDEIGALIDEWVPDGEVATSTAREALREAVVWLQEYEGRATKSDIVAGAHDGETSLEQWWSRSAQPGLAYLAEKGVVERPTSKSYSLKL
jgi:polyhydroxyalkanoate synthesis regulator phasin